MNRPSRRRLNKGGGFQIDNRAKIESDSSRPNVPHKPWLLSKTEQRSNDERLCQICRTIDLRWLLRNTVEQTPPDLGHLDSISKKSSCSLCRLVITALCTQWATDDASEITKLRTASGEKIHCRLTSSKVGVLQLIQGETVYCLEVATNAPWVPFKSNSGISLNRITLLDEGAPKIGMS